MTSTQVDVNKCMPPDGEVARPILKLKAPLLEVGYKYQATDVYLHVADSSAPEDCLEAVKDSSRGFELSKEVDRDVECPGCSGGVELLNRLDVPIRRELRHEMRNS
jgi:hypothetical protein